MFDAAEALTLMQWGDSAFPAGGFAFSWGIEGLALDGLLNDRAGLDGAVREQIMRRWATMDRILLRRAWRARDLDAIAAVDRDAEVATPSAEMREGSRRAGHALLSVSTRLGGRLAADYRVRVLETPTLGHLPIAQAVAFRDAGLRLDAAELVSGWTLVNGLVSAAARLGIVGHAEAQRCLTQSRAALAVALAAPVPDSAALSSFTPLSDIAVSRAERRSVRMFTT